MIFVKMPADLAAPIDEAVRGRALFARGIASERLAAGTAVGTGRSPAVVTVVTALHTLLFVAVCRNELPEGVQGIPEGSAVPLPGCVPTCSRHA